jgi:hypothetical protein
MQRNLKDLNPKELRALLNQETRKFLWVLDFNGQIEELEKIRSTLRTIVDLLQQKEMAKERIMGLSAESPDNQERYSPH